jgi:fumarate reductase subunit C
MTGSPLARGALGLFALYFALHTIFTGAIAMNKSAPIRYLHFSDHPIVVSLTCITAIVAAAWGLADACARYRMHGQS